MPKNIFTMEQKDFPALPLVSVVPTPANNVLSKENNKSATSSPANSHTSPAPCCLIPTLQQNSTLQLSPPTSSPPLAPTHTGTSASNLRSSPPSTVSTATNLQTSPPVPNLGIKMVKYHRNKTGSQTQPPTFAELCAITSPKLSLSSSAPSGELPSYQFLPRLTGRSQLSNFVNSSKVPSTPTGTSTLPPSPFQSPSTDSVILEIPDYQPALSEDSCSTVLSEGNSDFCNSFLLKILKHTKSLKSYIDKNIRANATHRNYIENKFLAIQDSCATFQSRLSIASEKQNQQCDNFSLLSTIESLDKNLQTTKHELNNCIEKLSNDLHQGLPQLIENSVKKHIGAIQTNLSTPSISSSSASRSANPSTPAFSTVLLQGKDRRKDNVELKNELLALPCPKDVMIKNISTMPNGTLKISCIGKKNDDPLPRFINSKINEKFEVKSPPEKKDALIIFNIPAKCNEEDVLHLVVRNFPSIQVRNIRVLKNFKNKLGSVNWVILLNPSDAKILLNTKKLYNHFIYYPVKQYVSLRLCFKCQGFGHTAKYCRYTDVNCSYCSEAGHTHRTCRATSPTCVNCCTSNHDDHSLCWNTAHHSRDRAKCKSWRREIDKIREIQKSLWTSNLLNYIILLLAFYFILWMYPVFISF